VPAASTPATSTASPELAVDWVMAPSAKVVDAPTVTPESV
jgi:hypothetical protein